MTSAPTSDDFPIVDPHQHFWDLGRNYYPWLSDPKPVPFRYGDYASLKHNYLPLDYLRDAGALVGAAYFARDDIEDVLAKHAKSRLTRGVRNFPTAAATPAQAARGAAGS